MSIIHGRQAEKSLSKFIHFSLMRTRLSAQDKAVSAFPSPALLLCASLLTLSVSVHADENKDQLKTIQQNIAEKEKSVKQQKQQRGTLLQQLQAQEKTIASASTQLRGTQSTLATLNKDIAGLNASIDKLQKQQKAQEAILSKQLDAAFRIGQHKGLQLLLSGEETERSERIMAYFGYLNEARQKTIEELKQTRTKLAEQRVSLQSKETQQKSLLGEQQTQQQKLEQARSARKQTLTALESSLQKDEQSLTELRANEASLQNKIAAAERAAKARAEKEAREAAAVRAKEQQAKKTGTTYKPTQSEQSLMARTGGLGRPSGQNMWPVNGSLIHRFGEQLQGELRWKGIVISAREGSDVRTIADGRVILADWLQGYGLVVVIDHGKGDMSLYGYNQDALVSVGDQVRTGQAIAKVGNSGGQGQPSLYFEIRRQGQAVNPQPWLGR